MVIEGLTFCLVGVRNTSFLGSGDETDFALLHSPYDVLCVEVDLDGLLFLSPSVAIIYRIGNLILYLLLII